MFFVCRTRAKVLGGLGTISSGCSAITTGISLFACGPVGWIAGTICIAVGVATVAIGVNEAISGAIGVNYLREWTGMSQEDYNTLYLGLSIASTICTTAGQAIRGLKGCRCFIAGTLVLTAAGYKAIEDIQLGDMVLAYDEETGETAYKPVVNLFRNESKDWTGVTVNGTEIVSTPGHKYFLPEAKAWVSAEDLKVGIKVLLSDGTYGIITKVRPIHYDEPQTTYNFEVEDFHTYYVGTGVLVHNMNGGDCGGKFDPKEHSSKKVQIDNQYDGYVQNGGKHSGKIVSPDKAGHGGLNGKSGSSFKLYEYASGKKVRLIADLDIYGNPIVGKHSSNLNKIFRITKG